MKKKLLLTVVSVMLILSMMLSACGGTATTDDGKGDTVNGEQNSDSKSGDVDEASNFNAEGLPVFNEAVEYTIVARTPPLSKKSYSEKEIWQNRSLETNVMINWEEVPSSAFGEKANLILNSGDYPDAIHPGWVPDSLFTELVDAGEILAISDYLEYAPNLKKALDSVDGLESALAYSEDGKIYGYPKVSDNAYSAYRLPLFINKTWLDNLGLEVPKTTEEYYQVLKAFKEQDANGNGDPNDEIPSSFAIRGFGFDILDGLGSWGVQGPIHNNVMFCGIDDDEKVYFTGATDGFRQGIEFFHKLYSEGLMDTESLTQKVGGLTAKIEQETPVVGSFREWLTPQTNREQYISLGVLEGPEGIQKQTYMSADSGVTRNGLIIFANAENPEGLVRWADWCMDGTNAIETQLGPEGVAWTKDDTNMTWSLNAENIANLGVSLEEYKQTEGTQNGFLLHDIADVIGYTYLPAEGDDRSVKGAWTEEAKPYFFKNILSQNNPFRPTTLEDEDMGFVWTDMQQYIEIFIVDAVMNGVDDAKWEEHLKKLEGLQYQSIVDYQQERYDVAK